MNDKVKNKNFYEGIVKRKKKQHKKEENRGQI